METDLLDIHQRQREGMLVVDVRGDIIAYTGYTLKQVLLEAADGGSRPHVLVNLQEVESMDSSGLRALIEAMKQAHPSVLHIYGCNSHVKRVLDITGLARMFHLYVSEEEALTRAQAGADMAPTKPHEPALL